MIQAILNFAFGVAIFLHLIAAPVAPVAAPIILNGAQPQVEATVDTPAPIKNAYPKAPIGTYYAPVILDSAGPGSGGTGGTVIISSDQADIDAKLLNDSEAAQNTLRLQQAQAAASSSAAQLAAYNAQLKADAIKVAQTAVDTTSTSIAADYQKLADLQTWYQSRKGLSVNQAADTYKLNTQTALIQADMQQLQATLQAQQLTLDKASR